MKLNRAGMNELREEIEELLEDVPEGERIHLDKELLESLIFDIYTEKLLDGNSLLVKYIVWSGPFLRKIDLSEVSFDNVMWDVSYETEDYFVEGTKNHYENTERIDLSYTNASINFDQSAECKMSEVLGIYCCNFAGVDLSNNTLSNCFIESSVFDDTGIKISFDKFANEVKIWDSSFCNIDLSEVTVDETFFSSPDGDLFALNSNFSNTRLRVVFTKLSDEVRLAYKRDMELQRKLQFDELTEEELQEHNRLIVEVKPYLYQKNFDGMANVGKLIKNGFLVGCYVNGKKILSQSEKEFNSVLRFSEYEEYKSEFINHVAGVVKTQIRSLKKNGV